MESTSFTYKSLSNRQSSVTAPALSAPLLTDRLTLRPATADDVDATWVYRRLNDVNGWLSGCPDTLGGYRDPFTGPERLATTVMVELHDGTVIGDFMLRRHDAWAQTDVTDRASGQQVELGWVLDPARPHRPRVRHRSRQRTAPAQLRKARRPPGCPRWPSSHSGTRCARLLLLLFETLWKLVWTRTGSPSRNAVAGTLDQAKTDVLVSCSLVVVLIAVTPWRYAWCRFAQAPADRGGESAGSGDGYGQRP